MSVGYAVYLPGTKSSFEQDTRGTAKILPYPIAEYADTMCLIQYRGQTMEAVYAGEYITTFIYRSNGFELESFVRMLRNAYRGKDTVSIRCIG